MVVHSCPPYPQNIDLVGMEKKKSQEYPRNIDLVGIEKKRAKNTQGISTWWV